MGRPRFLHPGLTLALLLGALAACGGDEDLLHASRLDDVYAGGGGGGAFGPTSLDPSQRATIKGRVRFEGDAWKRYPLDITTADGFCVQQHAPEGLLSEDFITGPDGGLANVIVYVKEGLDNESWPVPEEPVILDQVNCQYVPHVAVIQIGQPLIVESSDDTNHNVHMARGPNPEINRVMTRPGRLEPMTFKKPEMARRIYCDVHGWMVSWLGILPHPFHAVTGEDGGFVIENVPPGKYLLGAWHEKRQLEEHTRPLELKPNETLEIEIVFKR